MHVSVNGVRLFFDVEGAKFVPAGPLMRARDRVYRFSCRSHMM